MKKYFWMTSLFLFALLSYRSSNASSDQIETIVLMRHGEKPPARLGQLDCQGLNRALLLPAVLNSKFGKPDYIFAPDPAGTVNEGKGTYNYVRPLATIEPTAIRYEMPVNTAYTFFDDETVANALLAPQYHQSLVFVAWEHVKEQIIAQSIVSKLGGNPNIIPTWESSDFDSLYVLKINWSKNPPTVGFVHDYESLNGLSTACDQKSTKHSQPSITTEKIILIPEGEPAKAGLGQLSCQGLNRALALPAVLQQLYGNFDVLIAPDPTTNLITENNQAFYYLRALMTIEPTVVDQGQTLFTPYGFKDIENVTTYLNQSDLQNAVVAVDWEVNEIASLAKAILQSNDGDTSAVPNIVPDHDTMYQITIIRNNNKTTTSFATVAENLNHLSEYCPQALGV